MKVSVFEQIQIQSDSAVPDHLQIARQVEQLIRTGALSEGTQIPPTLQLVKLWGVNIMRVQRAMEMLCAQGLIQRFPRRGTFVTPQEARPCVGIFTGGGLLPEQSHFLRFVTTALKHEIRDQGFNAKVYDALSLQESDERQRCLRDFDYDLRHHSFCGFVLLSGMKLEQLLPAEVRKKTPVVSIGSSRNTNISIDLAHFGETAGRWLIESGCRHLACVHSLASEEKEAVLGGFLPCAKAAGLRVNPSSIAELYPPIALEVARRDRLAYEEMTRLLKRWERKGFTPDGLIVPDDIAARGVAAALQEHPPSRTKPPKVVVLTIEGVHHFYCLPLARYAVSASEMARLAIGRITARVAGEAADLPDHDAVRGGIEPSYR